jgi:hypothetical protein
MQHGTTVEEASAPDGCDRRHAEEAQMTTHGDRNRPTDEAPDTEPLEDLDPALAEAADVHGGELAAGPQKHL